MNLNRLKQALHVIDEEISIAKTHFLLLSIGMIILCILKFVLRIPLEPVISIVASYTILQLFTIFHKADIVLNRLDSEGVQLASILDILSSSGINTDEIFYEISQERFAISRYIMNGYKKFSLSKGKQSLKAYIQEEIEKLPEDTISRWAIESFLISRKENIKQMYSLNRTARMDIISKYRAKQYSLDIKITVIVVISVFSPLVYSLSSSYLSMFSKVALIIFLLSIAKGVSLFLPEKDIYQGIKDEVLRAIKSVAPYLSMGYNLEYALHISNILQMNDDPLFSLVIKLCRKNSKKAGKMLIESIPFLEELRSVKQEIKTMINALWAKAKMLYPTLAFIVGTLVGLWPFMLNLTQVIETRNIHEGIDIIDCILGGFLVAGCTLFLAKKMSQKWLIFVFIVIILYSIGSMFALYLVSLASHFQ